MDNYHAKNSDKSFALFPQIMHTYNMAQDFREL